LLLVEIMFFLLLVEMTFICCEIVGFRSKQRKNLDLIETMLDVFNVNCSHRRNQVQVVEITKNADEATLPQNRLKFSG